MNGEKSDAAKEKKQKLVRKMCWRFLAGKIIEIAKLRAFVPAQAKLVLLFFCCQRNFKKETSEQNSNIPDCRPNLNILISVADCKLAD